MSIWIGMKTNSHIPGLQEDLKGPPHMTLAYLERNELTYKERDYLEIILKGISIGVPNFTVSDFSLNKLNLKTIVWEIHDIPRYINLMRARLLNALKVANYYPSERYPWKPHVTVRLDGSVEQVIDNKPYSLEFDSISLIENNHWTTWSLV